MKKRMKWLTAVLTVLSLVIATSVGAAEAGGDAPGSISGTGSASDEGGGPGAGNAPGDGEAPDSGNAPGDGEAPDSGNAPGDGETPGSGSGPDTDGGPDDGNFSGEEPDAEGVSGAERDSDSSALGSFTSNDSDDNDITAAAAYDSDDSVSGLVISESASGMNGIVVSSANVDFDDISITLDTDADGSDTCDFTGKGTAFAVYGSSNVTLSNSVIRTAGVATMPLFTDNGATLTVKNTTIEALGGTLYASYTNTYDQSTMVAPPWVLGIMGTSRASNLMGTNSTLNFLDSTAKAALWAVLSTDSGSGMVMNVYNSTLELTQAVETDQAIQEDGGQITTVDNPYTVNYGSGYGTYVIGNAEENMVGVTINVGTYAAIFTGGSMNFSTLTAGEYTLTNADGSTVDYTYSDSDKNSVINSDTFDFMVHQNANTLTLGSGTSLNTGYTSFLIKSGGSLTSFTADITDTDISTGNNVLIQILDNEDDLIGTGSSGFNTVYTESAGWNTDAYGASSSATVVFNFTDESNLEGNIYNASGYQLAGTGVTVNLSNTVYTGAAASTTAIHVNSTGSEYVRDVRNGYALDVDESDSALLEQQNTSITISEYYDLGHVANKINSNGSNTVSMSLTDGSTWYVTGTSIVRSLSVSEDSAIVLVGDATLTVDGVTYSSENYADGSAYNLTYQE